MERGSYDSNYHTLVAVKVAPILVNMCGWELHSIPPALIWFKGTLNLFSVHIEDLRLDPP